MPEIDHAAFTRFIAGRESPFMNFLATELPLLEEAHVRRESNIPHQRKGVSFCMYRPEVKFYRPEAKAYRLGAGHPP